MFCPKCRAEYVKGIKSCKDCNVDLVVKLPNEGIDIPEYDQMVSVYENGDMATILIAKSLLTAAEIEFYAVDEEIQEVIGVGRISSGYNTITGPVHIKVRKKDVEAAKELLQDLEVMMDKEYTNENDE